MKNKLHIIVEVDHIAYDNWNGGEDEIAVGFVYIAGEPNVQYPFQSG